MEHNVFNISHFDYELPSSAIAQVPLAMRDESRLLIVDREKNQITEAKFKDITRFLNPEDVLVLNNTKVIQARLYGKKKSGSIVEFLLIKEKQKGIWEVLVKPGKRAKKGDVFCFEGSLFNAQILDTTLDGGRLIQFFPENIQPLLETVGKPPLPPYIKEEVDCPEKYQTVYAQKEGAIAAPTAGFHFTQELLNQIKEKGVEIVYVTLHCGLATFRPVKTTDIREHPMTYEWIEINPLAAKTMNHAKQTKKKIIAVGTTSVRTLESAAFMGNGGCFNVGPVSEETRLYITPGYQFKMIDTLITNFHTPCSTNLILVSTFAGLDLCKKSYAYALKNNFRFFSFGDAMIIL